MTSEDQVSESKHWPLHKISEPHECNDVLLRLPEDKSSKRTISGSSRSSENPQQNDDEPPIPWRCIPYGNTRRPESMVSLQGNQRFFQLLQQHQDDYESADKMERPLVSLRVLQEWRNQTPPGRFLMPETNTNPPLWKDVGDKKARSRISKALKHLTRTQGSASLITGSSSATTTTRTKQQQSTALTERESTEQSALMIARNEGPLEESNLRSPSSSVSDALQSKVPAIILGRTSQEVSALRSSSGFDSSAKSLTITNEVTATAIGEGGEEAGYPQDLQSDPPLVTDVVTVPVGSWLCKTSDSEVVGMKVAEMPPDHHTPSSLKLPRIPSQFIKPARFVKPERYVRRISEQLHSAQEEGTIYGRWNEREKLTEIYQRQRQRRQEQAVVDMVLISGLMGVGKTSLAQTLRNPLLDYSGGDGRDEDEDESDWPFLLRGKFEQCQWSDPNAFFVEIVADFCRQLEERNDGALTKKYRSALVDALKDDIIVLSNLVPALEALMSSNFRGSSNSNSMDESDTCREQPQDDTFACLATLRIKEVLGKFLRTIASVDPENHPIIILQDDLHWASEPAIDILTSLAMDRLNAGILFLGTYRNDETEEPHFKKALRLWDHCQSLNVTNLHLGNLKEDSVHCMLAEALSLQEQETESLNKLVFSLTDGNPTFITELLRVFQDKGLLRYDAASMQWTCDLEQITLSVGKDIRSVPDLFKAKVLALPSPIQETLKIAACLWSTRIDEEALKMIDTVGSVTSHLKFADIRGLLTYRNGQYAFVSDGVKQATYNLIPEEERASYHLRIGQRLWLHLDANEHSHFYATLMTQIVAGGDKITEEADLRAVASLCLHAGRGAARFLGFQTSWLCLSYGISIVSSQKTWGRENYDLSLSLYNTAIEVCYCNGEFRELENLMSQVLKNARTFEDSLLALSTKIYFLGSRNKQMEAIDLGLETLRQLNEGFPSKNPPMWRVYLTKSRVKGLLRKFTDDEILKLPRMKDPKKIAAMQIMTHVVLYTVYATPALSVLMAFRMVSLTIKHGLTAFSSVGFALAGTMLCRFDSIEDGCRIGKLALRISDRFKKAVWNCRTVAAYYGTTHGRRYPIREALEPLRNAYRAGMRAGDVEFAVLNACLVCWNSSEVAPLPDLEAELCEVADQIEFYGQTLSLVMLKPLWQASLNLMGKVPGDPKIVEGELVNQDVEEAKAGNNPHFVVWMDFFSMKLAYLFGDYELAEQYVDAAPKIYNHSSGAMDCAYTMLYECLTLLAQARRGKRRLRTILYVERRLKRLKLWAMHAPSNFLGKQFLIEAELALLRGNHQKVISHYISSILHSREGGFMLEEAVANEQLGRYYLSKKDEESAVVFLKGAVAAYEKWGAQAKMKHFEAEFREYLT